MTRQIVERDYVWTIDQSKHCPKMAVPMTGIALHLPSKQQLHLLKEVGISKPGEATETDEQTWNFSSRLSQTYHRFSLTRYHWY